MAEKQTYLETITITFLFSSPITPNISTKGCLSPELFAIVSFMTEEANGAFRRLLIVFAASSKLSLGFPLSAADSSLSITLHCGARS